MRKNIYLEDIALLVMKKDKINLTAITDVSTQVEQKLKEFLTTLVRAGTSESEYLLTKGNQLKKEVMAGIIFRLPVMQEDESIFSRLLMKYLIVSLREKEWKTMYGVVKVENDEIIATTFTIKNEATNWKRATVMKII